MANLKASPPTGSQSPSVQLPPDSNDNSDSNTDETQGPLVCPLCSRRLNTDNVGLNEHIDFCLSRSAIMEASSSAVSTMVVSRPRQTGRHHAGDSTRSQPDG